MTNFTDAALIYNTPPIVEVRRCTCHGWRLDECPNAQIAVWARTALRDGVKG